MPTLLYKEFGLVKGTAFNSWRRVGAAMQAIKVYNMREVDELVFLDITATQESRQPDFDLIDDLADECFMPLTVGGGVREPEDVRRLLMVGADKVAINSSAIERQNIVGECARRFGSQCIVVSIDARRGPSGQFQTYTHSGTQPTGLNPVEVAKRAAADGAGEIMITSIDRDGTMEGYDLELTRQVSTAVDIPVIASGGAGSPDDMVAALEQGGASAIAAASIFHFTEQTPAMAKDVLRENGFSVRN